MRVDTLFLKRRFSDTPTWPSSSSRNQLNLTQNSFMCDVTSYFVIKACLMKYLTKALR